jgi:hypothetical protein
VISRISFSDPWEEPKIIPPQVPTTIIRQIKTVSVAQLLDQLVRPDRASNHLAAQRSSSSLMITITASVPVSLMQVLVSITRPIVAQG